MDTILRVRDIKKSFDGTGVLSGVSLDIREGEVVVIIGPSGCGKSTLLRCINGLEQIDSGEIWLRDELISGRKKDMHLIRQRIGMVFQSYDLFPHMNVMDNLLLGPVKALKKPKEEVEAEAVAMLRRVGLEGRGQALPRTLSGGQKQRVSVARAILKPHEILIFDDATSALDLRTEAALYKALDVQDPASTKIIIAQRIASIRKADRIIVLDNGRIAADGTHESLLESSEIYRDIYLSQQKEGGAA